MSLRPRGIDIDGTLPGHDPPFVLLPALGGGYMAAKPVAGAGQFPRRLEIGCTACEAPLPDRGRFNCAIESCALGVQPIRDRQPRPGPKCALNPQP